MTAETTRILEFLSVLEGLKKIERFKGQVFWKDYPFPDRYESVADHSWRLAMMVLVVEQHLSRPINLAKTLKMALIHDVPEIITGDMSPLGTDGTGKDSHAYNESIAENRHKAEKKAAKKIFGKLDKKLGDELYELWLEYEEQKCFESKIVKALDKVEGKLQALEYSDGRIVKKNMDFVLKYGVDTFSIDPIIQEIGMGVVKEFEKKFRKNGGRK